MDLRGDRRCIRAWQATAGVALVGAVGQTTQAEGASSGSSSPARYRLHSVHAKNHADDVALDVIRVAAGQH